MPRRQCVPTHIVCILQHTEPDTAEAAATLPPALQKVLAKLTLAALKFVTANQGRLLAAAQPAWAAEEAGRSPNQCGFTCLRTELTLVSIFFVSFDCQSAPAKVHRSGSMTPKGLLVD